MKNIEFPTEPRGPRIYRDSADGKLKITDGVNTWLVMCHDGPTGLVIDGFAMT